MSSEVTAKVLFEYIAEQDDELTMHMGDIVTNVLVQDGGWWEGEVNGKRGVFPENFVSIVTESSKPTYFKAEVKFDYEPTQGDEIALFKGTIIEVIDTPDEGWWKGKYDGKDGLFPSNFVEKIDSPESVDKPLPVPDTAAVTQPAPEARNPPPKGPSKIAAMLQIKPEDLLRSHLKKTTGPSEPKSNDIVVETSLNPNDAFKPTQKVPPMYLEGEKEKKKLPMVPGLAGAAMKDSKPVQYAIAIYDYDPELSDELKLTVGDKIKIIDSELTFEGWMKGETNGNVGVFPDNFVEIIPPQLTENFHPEPAKEEPVQRSVPEEPTQKPKHEESPQKPKQDEPVKPRMGIPMVSPGGKQMQDELTKVLSQKSPGNIMPVKKAPAKGPPPPVPGGKPALPGTKPKPQLINGKPTTQKIAKKPPVVAQASPPPPVPALVPNPLLPKKDPPKIEPEEQEKPITKPPFPKNGGLSLNNNDSDVTVSKINELKSSQSFDELKLVNIMDEDVPPFLPKCSSASSINKPPQVQSTLRKSLTLSGSDTEHLMSTRGSTTISNNSERNDDEPDAAAGHKKLSGKPNLQLDDVKPTDPLKQFQRPKPPSKSPPSKYKDKADGPIPETHVDNSKEVNELKAKVIELEDKMEDMEDRFKRLVIQLTDDLSTERKLRSNLQIELETLNKKFNLCLEKPNS